MPTTLRNLLALLLLLAALDARAEELLVGVLSEQHQQRCLPGRQEWVDAHDEVGFVRLVAPPARSRAWASLRGKLVVARGRAAADFRPPRVEHKGECPQAQMRSDMVWAKQGFRLRRAGAPLLGAFEASRVEPLAGLTVAQANGKVTVGFRNTLGRPLAQVVLTLHYEGCYGKPGSTSSEHRAGLLAPGAATSAELPAFVTRPGPPGQARVHHAFSLQLRASAAGVHVDLDRRLSDEGAAVPCPPRTR
jgi:hypothetical protein